MPSSVKPRALAKAVNFSLTAAPGAWLRPAREGGAAGLGRGWGSPLPPSPDGPRPSTWGRARLRALARRTYCRAWPCGRPGLGSGRSRCGAGRSSRSQSPPPTPRGCCPRLGTRETGPSGWRGRARPGCGLPTPASCPHGAPGDGELWGVRGARRGGGGGGAARWLRMGQQDGPQIREVASQGREGPDRKSLGQSRGTLAAQPSAHPMYGQAEGQQGSLPAGPGVWGGPHSRGLV